MLVTTKNLAEVVGRIAQHREIAVDTETTGLRPYEGDRLFSVIIATDDDSYYFNFNDYEKNLPQELLLHRVQTLMLLQSEVFSDENRTVVMHNAKFDLHMLYMDGIEVKCRVVDTEVLGRLEYNRHLSYSLANLAKLIGKSKSDAVEEYISKHKLTEKIHIPGKKRRVDKKYFERVPFDIMSKYGMQDGRVTLDLYRSQRQNIAKTSELLSLGRLQRVVENETALTKVCWKMERDGLLIDPKYCLDALNYEQDRAARAVAEFESISGSPFKDSNKALAEVFDRAGESYPVTAKGNSSFRAEVLEGFSSPLAKILLEYRDATKRGGTYYSSYLYFADESNRIHPNIRQAGTETGRFSVTDPNCQNLPKEDDSPYPIRRAFVPSEDYVLCMIDYDQMEYRLLLDLAEESDVIWKILNEGLDVHEATAAKMGVSRKAAKTLNFLLLYGGGKGKLAKALGITELAAGSLKEQYFSSLPNVSRMSRAIIDIAESRGSIFNWMGRVCFFPYIFDEKSQKMSRFSYIAPNHYIQGGCADVVKLAMVRIDELLTARSARSRLLLNIHDELFFEIHKNELDLIPELVSIMSNAYPYKHLPLTCSAKISHKSWADGVEFKQ